VTGRPTLTKPMEISRAEAVTELWNAICELMPFPCEFSWSELAAIDVSPKSSKGRPAGAAARTPIVIHFGQRGMTHYQAANDVMRQRVRDDVVYVVTTMLRGYNLGLHATKHRSQPFVIDCELLLQPS